VEQYEIYWEDTGAEPYSEFQEFVVLANNKEEAISKGKKKAYKILLDDYKYIQKQIKKGDPESENMKKIKKPSLSRIKITSVEEY
jgi:hypothetical protein